jgi:enoyl-CoA hydratase
MTPGPQATSPLVELSNDGYVTTIALANSERRNVLDEKMANALQGAAKRAQADPELRCVILTGSGDVFAAGADVNVIGSRGAEENLAYNRRLRAAVDAIADLPVPSIAAVNGHAVGGGLELALACTLRVAAETARLGMPEARLGIIPATGGLARLPRLIPRSTAARLLLTGDLLTGAEAQDLGVVDLAVPAGLVLEEARSLAARIAEAAPLSTRAIVESLGEELLSIPDANLRSEDRLARLLASADRLEGANAFLEKRKPEFRGS